jgi:hypothetical protein
MSVSISTRQPSGLVFSLDASNTQKSYKGGPVTNSQWNGGAEYTPWFYTGAEAIDVSSTADAGPVSGAKTWKFTHSGSSDQWTGWEQSYTMFTGVANDVWTCSYWYKSSQSGGATNFGTGTFYTSNFSRALNYTILSQTDTIIADGLWHYNSTTTRINETYTNAVMVDGPSWRTTPAGIVYVNGLQWNKNSYPSQFAQGTRANTGVFADSTGLNSSITATSLTYDLSGAPSFNGTSDYIDCGTSLASYLQTGEVTVTTVAKISSVVSKNNLLSLNGNQNFFLPGNRLTTTNQLYWDGTAWFPGNTTSWNTNQYYHLAWTISGTTVSFYVNGVLDGTGTCAVFAPTLGGTARVGLANAGEYGTGTIGLVTVHNRALSADEVKQSFIGVRSRFGI